jgi:tetratricopeptide (TPR) repeat protein
MFYFQPSNLYITMKKIILFSIMLMISFADLFASDEKFTKAMEAVLTDMHNSQSIDQMQQAANKLERIAAAESAQWLPAYWVAYCYIHMAFMEKDNMRKDQYFDQADKFLGKAEAINPENDEILVLKAYTAQGRISIDGQSRFATYGKLFSEALSKAKKINPDNPRIYLLEGQMLYHTPEAFGGGKATACPKLKLALDKFASFKPGSTISPDWGVKNAGRLSAGCGN